MVNGKFLTAALFGFITLLVSSQLFAQADVIEKRQALMKSNAAAAKAITNAAKEKDYATIETKAKVIMGNMDKVLDLFPKRSTKGKTKAKPEIWEKWDEFSKNPAKVKKAADELEAAAKAKDDAAVGVKVKELGAACSNCHNAFRADKYSE
jgi:cytochrome c556